MQTKYNSIKQTTQNSKTKLPWFSCLLKHSARKRDGLILRCYRASGSEKFGLPEQAASTQNNTVTSTHTHS